MPLGALPREARLRADAGACTGDRPGRASPACRARPRAAVGRFVVHRHRASRLHYDLRLEIDGVLASWALPKGPTRDPDERRFAARTEDHPIEYLDFEGVIPRGEYGAGDSICWDWGTFEPELTWDPGAAVRAGELKLRLRGEKLAGRFTLVRTGDRGSPGRGEPRANPPGRARARRRRSNRAGGEGDAWLLIAKAGPDAIPGWDPEELPRVGQDRPDERGGRGRRAAALRGRPPPAPLPTLDPAGSVSRPAAGLRRADARHAGARAVRRRRLALRAQVGRLPGPGGRGRRDGRAPDAEPRTTPGRYFPELLGRPTWLAAPEAIVDGEVVALDERGRPDFGLLQARLGGGFSASDLPAPARRPGRPAGRRPLVFMAFDLPWCAGRSLLGVPLEERKAILRLVLREHPRVRYGGPRRARRRRVLRGRGGPGPRGRDGQAPPQPLRAGPPLDGLAEAEGPARPGAGRRPATCPGRGAHRDLGALVVGVMEDGRLRYAGRVGSGLDAATRARPPGGAGRAIARPTPPFDDATAPGHARRDLTGVTWAEPTTRDPGRDRGLVVGTGSSARPRSPGCAGGRPARPSNARTRSDRRLPSGRWPAPRAGQGQPAAGAPT